LAKRQQGALAARFATVRVRGDDGQLGNNRYLPGEDSVADGRMALKRLLPGERKSVEPMAALTAPAGTAAKHQSLLHFVAITPWSDEAVLAKVHQMALPKIEALGAVKASIIDDTGFPKKDKHSVGVARQYCGQLGKQDNCQAVVSLSVANHHASLPVAHRLYLPQTWANDPD
jgi:SRSO17 transposase